MSQKAWMQAYTKGSKSLQARLAKIHANNPEFQEFVKKHGFGGNLSVKQSGKQKSSAGTVQPVTGASPESNPKLDREAMIKAAAEKIRNRRAAAANRVAFGGELGGGFGLHNMGFRQYRESRENQTEELRIGDKVKLKKDWAGEHAGKIFTVHHKNADGDYWIGHGPAKKGWYVGDHQVTKVRSVKEAKDEYAAYHHKTDKIVKTGSKKAVKDFMLMRGDDTILGVNSKKKKEGEKFHEEAVGEGFTPGDKVVVNKTIGGGTGPFRHTPWFEKGEKLIVKKHHKNGEVSVLHADGSRHGVKIHHSNLSLDEDVPYKGHTYTMRRGGWVVKRDGKTISNIMPTDDHAKRFIDDARGNMLTKVSDVVRRKAKEIARGLGSYSMAVPESKENRERILSYDSAIVTNKKLPKLVVDPKKKLRKLLKNMSLGTKRLLSTENTEMASDKTLNELRKATLASYLSKAGSRVRSGTKLGQDFENDAYNDMRTVNAHHPNNYTPGVEKDPAKLASAEKSMKANFALAKTFKRDAKNRIKGIARAGRLLAKEDAEQLDERNTESHPSLWDTHELRHESGKALKKGDKVKGFRGTYKIQGFEMPHHSGSTGRVYTDKGQFFPGVVNAKIVKKAVKEEAEEVNEVSRSTIASVATKRYQQAQKALKDRDYGGYVKNIKKAHKAGDATIPKSGWSAEDDPKNEEVQEVPMTAIEKYRAIREAQVGKKLRGYGPPPVEKPKKKDVYNPDMANKKPKKKMGILDLPDDIKIHGEEVEVSEGSWDREQIERQQALNAQARRAKSNPPKSGEGDTGLFMGALPSKGSKPLSKAQQKAFDSMMKGK